MMQNPKTLVRPNGFQEFVEIKPGYFRTKDCYSLATNIRSYEELKKLGFGEKKSIQIDTYYFDNEPVWIANIPFHDKIIVVENDPYDGLTVHYKGEPPNQPTR